MRNDGYFKSGLIHGSYGQADAVNTDGAFLHDQPQDPFRAAHRYPDRVSFLLHGLYGAGPVDVAGHDMSAEAAVRSHGPLQIYAGAFSKTAQIAAAQGLRHDIGCKRAVLHGGDRQAYAVHGDAVTDPGSLQNPGGLYFYGAGSVSFYDLPDRTNFFYDSCEHLGFLLCFFERMARGLRGSGLGDGSWPQGQRTCEVAGCAGHPGARMRTPAEAGQSYSSRTSLPNI